MNETQLALLACDYYLLPPQDLACKNLQAYEIICNGEVKHWDVLDKICTQNRLNSD